MSSTTQQNDEATRAQAQAVQGIAPADNSSTILSVVIIGVAAMATSIAAFIWRPTDALALTAAAFGFAISLSATIVTLAKKFDTLHTIVNSRMTEMLAIQKAGVKSQTTLDLRDAADVRQAAITTGVADARAADATAAIAASVPLPAALPPDLPILPITQPTLVIPVAVGTVPPIVPEQER